MHDCRKMEESLIDLMFSESGSRSGNDADAARQKQLLADVQTCAHCRERYETFKATLATFDEAAQLMTPDESYWEGYNERLRARIFSDGLDVRPGLRQRVAGFFAGFRESLRPRTVWAVSASLLIIMVSLLWGTLLRPSRIDRNQSPQIGQNGPPDPTAKENDKLEKPGIKYGQTVTPPTPVSTPRPPRLVQRAARQEVARSDNPIDITPGPEEARLPIAVANAMPVSTIAAIVNEETLRHFEKSQILLRSFRNRHPQERHAAAVAAINDDRQRSRSLLFQNIVLRREAEMSGNLPVEQVLNDLEPVLLDLANLPERASAEDLRAVRRRIEKKAIITALQVYSTRPIVASATTD